MSAIPDDALKRLEAHAALSACRHALDDDAPLVDLHLNQLDKLIGEAGFAAPAAIADATRARFIQAATEHAGIDSRRAAVMYATACAQSDMLDSIHAGARARQSDVIRVRRSRWDVEQNQQPDVETQDQPDVEEAESSDFDFEAADDTLCDCADCASALSPGAYLADLLHYAITHLRRGEADVTMNELEAMFGQPWRDLPMSCAAMSATHSHIRLGVEVLRRKLGDYDAGAEGPESDDYLSLAYRTLLAQLGASFEELRAASTEDAARRSIAMRLGIPEERVPALFLERAPAGADASSRRLSEETLERLFGLKSTISQPTAAPASPAYLDWRREALEARWRDQDHPAESAAPLIDPDLFTEPDFIGGTADTDENPIKSLWKTRRNAVLGWRHEFLPHFLAHTAPQNGSSAFRAVFERFFEEPQLVERLKRLHEFFEDGVSEGGESGAEELDAKKAELETAGFDLPMLSRVIALIAIGDARPLSSDEENEAVDLLVQVKKHREAAAWAEEETDIHLDPRWLRIQALEPLAIPWRYGDVGRMTWRQTVSTRQDQLAASAAALDTAVAAAEDAALPVLRAWLIDRYRRTVPTAPPPPDATVLGQRWLIDLESGAHMRTTRVSLAIETLQALLHGIRLGLHRAIEGVSDLTLDEAAETFDQRWTWLGSYAAWRAATFVLLYPENLVLPSLRRNGSSKLAEDILPELQNDRYLKPQQAALLFSRYCEYTEEISHLRPLYCYEYDGGSGGAVRTFAFALGPSGRLFWAEIEARSHPSHALRTDWHEEPDFPTSGTHAGGFSLDAEGREKYYIVQHESSPGQNKLIIHEFDPEYQSLSLNRSELNLDIENTRRVCIEARDGTLRRSVPPRIFLQTSRGSVYWASFTKDLSALECDLTPIITAEIARSTGCRLVGASETYASDLSENGSVLLFGYSEATGDFCRFWSPHPGRNFDDGRFHKLGFPSADPVGNTRYFPEIYPIQHPSLAFSCINNATESFFREPDQEITFLGEDSSANTLKIHEIFASIWGINLIDILIEGPLFLYPTEIAEEVNFIFKFYTRPAPGNERESTLWNAIWRSADVSENHFDIFARELYIFILRSDNESWKSMLRDFSKFAVFVDDSTDEETNLRFDEFLIKLRKLHTNGSVQIGFVENQDNLSIGSKIECISNLTATLRKNIVREESSYIDETRVFRGKKVLYFQRAKLWPLPSSGVARQGAGLAELSPPFGFPPSYMKKPSYKPELRAVLLWCLNNRQWTAHNRFIFDELTFFVPCAIAIKLAQSGEFEAALDWFAMVFDPGQSSGNRIQNPIIDPSSVHNIAGQEPGNSIEKSADWLLDPLNPHAIAETRPDAYLRFVIAQVVECLIAYADSEFALDTAESLPRARRLYEMALRVLRDEATPLLDTTGPCDEIIADLRSRLEEAGAGAATSRVIEATKREATRQAVQELRDALSDNAAPLPEIVARLHDRIDAGLGGDHEPHCLEEAVDASSSRRTHVHLKQMGVRRWRGRLAQTGAAAREDARASLAALDEIAEGLQIDNWAAQLGRPSDVQQTAQAADAGDQPSHQPLSLALGQIETATPSFEKADSLVDMITTDPGAAFDRVRRARRGPSPQRSLLSTFCIPPNPVGRALEARAVYNLQKLRSGRNIAGMERAVDPYAAATDAISGMPTIGAGGQIVVNAGALASPSIYRFDFLLGRAKELADRAAQMEAAYLSAWQATQAAYLEFLRARQDRALLRAQKRVHRLRIDEAEHGIAAADVQHQRAIYTVSYYDALISDGLLSSESLQMHFLGLAAAYSVWGIIDGFGGLSNMFSSLSAAHGLIANFQRRRQQWEHERMLAKFDQKAARSHVRLAEDRRRIAEAEARVGDLQLQHADDVVEFLANKDLNVELYDWMTRELRSVYAFFLTEATAAARLAERQLAAERAEAPAGILQADYWTAPSETPLAENAPDRFGLTGSARLLQDIYRLEQHKTDTEQRKLQLTKTISLAQLDPIAFEDFRKTGALDFATPIALFDRDFPGHYARQIKQVRVSVIALTPAVEGIHATLVNAGRSSVAQRHPVTGAFSMQRLSRWPETIALTAPFQASGLFDLEAQNPSRLHPFEGLGVDTRWRFEMPRPSNRLDFATIADVLLHIDYTALSDPLYRQQVIDELGDEETASLVISVKRQLPDEWYKLLNKKPTESEFMSLSIAIKKSYLRPNMTAFSVTAIKIYIVSAEHKGEFLIEVGCKYAEVDAFQSCVSLNGIISNELPSCANLSVFLNMSPCADWVINFHDTGESDTYDLLQSGAVKDIIFQLVYKGKTLAWP